MKLPQENRSKSPWLWFLTHDTRSKGTGRKQMDRLNIIKIKNLCVKGYHQESDASKGCFERTASKHVYYQGWNRSPAQVGCMRQVLGFGALGRPRGIRWRGRWEEGSGWGIHVNPWLIHVNVWQNPLQYCKVSNLQLIKINGKKRKVMLMCMSFFVGGAKKVLRLVCCGGCTAPWTYYQGESEYCKWVNLMACEYDSVKLEKKLPLSFW